MTEYDGVERSTATETFRAMLDERGVEWEDGGEGLTIIPVQDGVPQAWTVNTWPSGKDMGDCLWVQNRHPLTPEQAIAATLGSCNCPNNCTNSERTSDELLPCPFCGDIPMVDCGYHYDYDGGDRYYAYSADVECCCGCTLHVEHDGPKEYVTNEHMLDFAIAAWNRRAES